MQRPRLKTYLSVLPIDETTWVFRGGHDELWRLEVQDQDSVRAFAALLPLLDGRHSREAIVEQAIEHGVDPEAAERLLASLEATGFLEEADEQSTAGVGAHSQLSFFSRFTADGGSVLQGRLAAFSVAVFGGGSLAGAVAQQLRQAGIGAVWEVDPPVSPPGTGNGNGSGSRSLPSLWPPEGGEEKAAPGEEMPDLFVVAQDAHHPKLLERMDELSRESGASWLLVRRLDPHEGWVGPLFIPGETASYRSLEARFRGNLPHIEEYRAFEDHLLAEGRSSPPVGGLGSFDQVLAGITVTEIIKLATRFAVPHLAGRFLTLDFLRWETELHEVLRIPRLDALDLSLPRVYPWKELPYGDKPTRRA